MFLYFLQSFVFELKMLFIYLFNTNFKAKEAICHTNHVLIIQDLLGVETFY